MKKIGFAILGIITAAALTVPVMADEAADKAGADKGKKHEKGGFFKKADTNGDGKLSLDEFKAANTKGDAEKKFTAADTDKDGFLTPEELKAASHGKCAKKGKQEKEAAK